MEVSEKDYELAFKIIVHAGESRSLSSEAMDKAEEFKFEEAKELLNQANKEFLACHEIQTGMLVKESNGEKNDVNIILVHAQDHLTMATIAMENAKRWIKINEKLQKLEERK